MAMLYTSRLCRKLSSVSQMPTFLWNWGICDSAHITYFSQHFQDFAATERDINLSSKHFCWCGKSYEGHAVVAYSNAMWWYFPKSQPAASTVKSPAGVWKSPAFPGWDAMPKGCSVYLAPTTYICEQTFSPVILNKSRLRSWQQFFSPKLSSITVPIRRVIL